MKSKELKKEALSKFNGKFSKLVLIQFMYVLLTVAFSLLFTKMSQVSNTLSIVSSIGYFIFLLVSLPFSFGIIASIIKISKDEDVSVTDFINIGLQKFSIYWKVVLRIFAKIIIPLVLFVIIAGFLTSLLLTKITFSLSAPLSFVLLFLFVYLLMFIFIVYLVLPYSLSMFVLYDNPDKTSKEILEISSELMQNQKWKYIKLLLSFIGWFLLIGIITGVCTEILPKSIAESTRESISMFISYIPSLFLIPYLSITQLSFYEHIKMEKGTSSTNVENNAETTIPEQENENKTEE